ncbi:MAG: hypothetical protein ACTHJ2_00910, partial [Candidatus Nitrosocosmicus sp.]
MPTLSIFLIFLFALNVLNNNSSVFVYGHSLFGNNNNGSGIQVQTNGNYKVELSTNPSKILLNKSTDILLRVTSLLGGGSEIMELPV